jgi:hypothetical protein
MWTIKEEESVNISNKQDVGLALRGYSLHGKEK